MDITPTVRHWFRQAGCREVALVAPADALFSVGVSRFEGMSRPLIAGQRMFAFA